MNNQYFIIMKKTIFLVVFYLKAKLFSLKTGKGLPGKVPITVSHYFIVFYYSHYNTRLNLAYYTIWNIILRVYPKDRIYI
jgi:hypothetical protein